MPLPGPRVEQAVARGEAAQVGVVLRVLVVELEDVVVDVRDASGTATRSSPSRSNWRQAIVPVASSSRIWSTRSSISSSVPLGEVVGDDLLP